MSARSFSTPRLNLVLLKASSPFLPLSTMPFTYSVNRHRVSPAFTGPSKNACRWRSPPSSPQGSSSDRVLRYSLYRKCLLTNSVSGKIGVSSIGRTRYSSYLEDHWPCAGGFSARNAIGSQMRDPENYIIGTDPKPGDDLDGRVAPTNQIQPWCREWAG